jgi:hippurate hydrolase
MSSLDGLVAEVLPEITDVRHDLHAHPQLGYEETYASELVQEYLTDAGVPFEAGLAQTGVVGWVTPDHAGENDPAIGLRADMDALPITEATELPYASQNPGLMHACGHDGHTAILLGAARVLNEKRNELPRPVKLVFQPAEEVGAGAQRMIDAGALSCDVGGRAVSAMFGLHGTPYLPVGWVATRPGPLLAGCTDFTITIIGTGGHAALPHTLTDPVVTAATLVTALQTVVSRNLNPTEQPAVVSVCKIHGGHATNVIPDEVTLAGTIRTFHDDVFELLKQRITELARQTAQAFGCRAQVEFSPDYPAVQNDAKATAFAVEVAEAAAGKERLHHIEAPVLASEDFAFYGRAVPSCFSFIGVVPHGRADYPSLHTPLYDFTDAALATGIKLMCGYALSAHRMI